MFGYAFQCKTCGNRHVLMLTPQVSITLRNNGIISLPCVNDELHKSDYNASDLEFGTFSELENGNVAKL